MDRSSTGQCATLACLMEATAPKPGNVHRGADFEDLTFFDFAASAVAIAPAMDEAAASPLGETVLRAIQATRTAVATNTNLGAVLLIAPLATVPPGQDLCSGIAAVLQSLTSADCHRVYEAIRLAQPGGLGRVEESDLHAPPPDDLIAAMRLAAGRDLVARQYTNNFEQVLRCALPWLQEARQAGLTLSDAIVHVHLRLMSQFPDSLIARKCGPGLAQQSSDRAADVLAAGSPRSPEYQDRLADLDFWLRSDHNKRNPGATADLIAAGLFAALREGIIKPPYRWQ
jgi:triphosphoribosyl-dephospho-CoA synthase